MNLLRSLLARFSNRDLGHFFVAFMAAFAAQSAVTNEPTSKAAWLAVIPGAASVALRQVFPNEWQQYAGQLQEDLAHAQEAIASATATTPLIDVLAKPDAPAPSVAPEVRAAVQAPAPVVAPPAP